MRRLVITICTLAALAATMAGPATAAPGEPPRDPSRGLVYDGLRRSARTGACRGNFEVDDLHDRAGRALCTHGPDPAPPGVDVRKPQGTAASLPGMAPGGGTATASNLACDGDGTSGDRVQLLYVHASNVSDSYASLANSFQQWAANIDRSFSASAAETGGDRHPRFVQDPSCNAVVTDVAVSPTGDDDFSNTLRELRAKGFTRSDRKYVAWVDANKYCGIGQVYYDDSAGSGNASNGVSTVPGELARIDNGCWGQSNPVEAHELMHTLGGVQTSAPHATANNHCTDEYDRMCYSDGPGVNLSYPCPSSHEALFDCNHDDYFSTSPPAGSYLATHWNTANSAFLISAAGSGTTTTTTLPTGTTTTTVPPSGTVASAPQAPRATQPPTGNGVVLSWFPPATSGSGPVGSYRIYRGTSPTSLGLVATVGAPTIQYADTATTRSTLYYYQVTAVNPAGESARSPYARMFAR
ncbi:MAG: hypothetical protein ACR2HY_04565 [Acidimicrobiales bacterium]